jgi:polyphosphate kinase
MAYFWPVSEPNKPRLVEPGERTAAPEPSTLFFNRELSWLEFNRRVLHEAADPANPLLERLKFIAISDSNLDEFFMKRVGGLKQQLASQVRDLSPDGQTPRQQLAEIDAIVRPMLQEQRRLLHDEIVPALRDKGLRLLRWEDLAADERRAVGDYFEARVLPILTPLAVDPPPPLPRKNKKSP